MSRAPNLPRLSVADDSPVHRLDPRAKLVAALVLVLAIVATPPLRALEFGLLVALLAAVAVMAEVSLRRLLLRSAIVLPIAGAIALFAPLARHGGSWSVGALGETWARGWLLAWGIVSKAWLSALTVLLVAASTPAPRLFQGLRALRVPNVFLTMFVFLYRYGAVLRAQLHSTRCALASRGFDTRGWRRVRLYGHLAGSLFLRAYERGERIYAAMLSRGFTGTLPSREPLRLRGADALAVALAALTATALGLY